jgi:hypothetical protein
MSMHQTTRRKRRKRKRRRVLLGPPTLRRFLLLVGYTIFATKNNKKVSLIWLLALQDLDR